MYYFPVVDDTQGIYLGLYFTKVLLIKLTEFAKDAIDTFAEGVEPEAVTRMGQAFANLKNQASAD